MPKGDPYSRHYHRFADEYPDIYADDAALALWTRLLRLADMAWPAAATLPYGTKRRALALLIECEVVFPEAGSTFRIRGMDKERQDRSDAARYAVEQRWKYERHTDSNTARTTDGSADSSTEVIPNRAKPSRAKTNQRSTTPNRGRESRARLERRSGPDE